MAHDFILFYFFSFFLGISSSSFRFIFILAVFRFSFSFARNKFPLSLFWCANAMRARVSGFRWHGPCHTWKISFILLRCRERERKKCEKRRNGERECRNEQQIIDFGVVRVFFSSRRVSCCFVSVFAFVRLECGVNVYFFSMSLSTFCVSACRRYTEFNRFMFLNLIFFLLSLSCVASENRWVQWRWQIFAVNLSQSFRDFCISTENWINSTKPNYTTLYVQYKWRWKTIRISPWHRHHQMERNKIEIAFDRRLTSWITCMRLKNW